MKWRVASLLLLAGASGWGCAYYNGLYNANRLADDAARARREGRTGEARAKWQQAAVKAESVAVRFPHSKYRDDALFLQGRALVEAEQCGPAVRPLSLVVDSAPDLLLRRRAQLLLGQCRVLLGDPVQAADLLSPLIDDSASGMAARARVWRARASLARADYAAALADLGEVNDPAAALDRVSALIGLEQTPAAAEELARLAPGVYDERRWLPVLEALARLSADDAAALVDSLVLRGNLSAGQRARLLLADGRRWQASGDYARYIARLDAAAEAAADSVEGPVARTERVLAELAILDRPERLSSLTASLDEAVQNGGPAAALASPALAILNRVANPSAAEFDRFLAIEAVRDSLGARRLAAHLFRQFQRDYPDSPVAPKALLAAAVLTPDAAQALVALVDSVYPDSPYRITFGGHDAIEFTRLEDSLRALTDPRRGESARPVTLPPARGREPVSPGGRLPRPAGGRQLPEP